MKRKGLAIACFLLSAIMISLPGCMGERSPEADIEPEEIVEQVVEEALPEEVPPAEKVPEDPPPAVTYVLNTSSKKFHKPSCRSVELMKPANFRETSETRDQVLERGYTPCGNCKP